MNMDRGLVNRALLNAGHSPLSDGPDAVFRMAREYYLAAWLEALSEVPWRGGRKRARLARTGMPHLPGDFPFVYDLPFDCARPMELQDNAAFIVEGRFLRTAREKAELLYISNGRALGPRGHISAGRPGDVMEMEYMSGGFPGEETELTVTSGRPADITGPLPEDPEGGEDYPDYRLPANEPYEPKFWQYLELTLAARFAMKLSDQPGLHTQLLQEAMLISQAAEEASLSAAASRQSPRKWWAEELGLSGRADY
ncbi:MAG: hypothetical protein LBQ35_07090 [Spirochaetaceae bacterium]|jgi:hypothetical protein|nr:hypothetical protein [Spirochaetaceae bacterium]